MSALGQKQTLAPQKVMSAKSRQAQTHVCFGPIADIASSLNHFIGAGEKRRR
jgi:hypothetical protein